MSISIYNNHILTNNTLKLARRSVKNDKYESLSTVRGVLRRVKYLVIFHLLMYQNIEDKLNSDRSDLSRWLNENVLTLNEAKCKFVVFGSQ
jgi:hypothetical protein